MRPWELPGFGTGLVAGGAALLVLLVIAATSARRGRRRPFVPVAGIAFVAAGVWAVDQTHVAPVGVLAGIVGVGAAAEVRRWRRVPWFVPVLLAAPFGWLIGFHGGLIDLEWVQVLVAVGAAAGGTLAATTDTGRRRSAVGPALLVLTVVGTYATVPDTEEAVALLGAVLPLAALGWPLRLMRLGRAGAASSIALVVWVAAVDGRGRTPSIIGAVLCIGLLAALPIADVLARGWRRRWAPARGAGAAAVVGVHAVVVAVAARVVGLADEVRPAVRLAAVLAVATVAVAVLLPASEGPEGETTDDGPGVSSMAVARGLTSPGRERHGRSEGT